jgi:DNA-binding PadR family transcriptional regulator
MMLDIEQMTGVHLGPGTLYGALARLQRARLIESLPSSDRRLPYQLTPQGSALLRNQLTMLSSFTELVLKRLIA